LTVRAYRTTTRLFTVASVLVVDDSPSIRMLVRANLELAGFTVSEVKDGVDCIRLLKGEPERFDAVIVDVMMPRLDGFATVRAIRQIPDLPAISVIVMSTHARSSDIDSGRNAGADAYVVKPFDPEHLIAVVKTTLGRGDADLWDPGAIEAGRAATQRRRVSGTTTPDGGDHRLGDDRLGDDRLGE